MKKIFELKELLSEELKPKEASKPLEEYILNTRTCSSPWTLPNIEYKNLYIWLTEEDLI